MQAPTIYRLFSDKDGLLDAVAERAFADYIATEAHVDEDHDPVADLRKGWDTHIGFGLANPSVFVLLIDPSRPSESPAVAAGMRILTSRVHRLAVAGRLRVTERQAAEMIHAAGTGVLIALISTPAQVRSASLADDMYGAVLHSILAEAPAPHQDPVTSASITLRAAAPDLKSLSTAERALLVEWLDRLSPPAL